MLILTIRCRWDKPCFFLAGSVWQKVQSSEQQGHKKMTNNLKDLDFLAAKKRKKEKENLRGPSSENSLSGVVMSAWGGGPSIGAGW